MQEPGVVANTEQDATQAAMGAGERPIFEEWVDDRAMASTGAAELITQKGAEHLPGRRAEAKECVLPVVTECFRTSDAAEASR